MSKIDEKTFLFEDKIKLIKSNFIDNGWIKVYENGDKRTKDQSVIYCYLIEQSYIEKQKENYSWPFTMGNEGKPSVYGNNTYKSNDHEGIEPFLFYRTFPLLDNADSYFDISEEFILYFKLYEKGQDKQNRKYYFIDDMGTLDEVIIVEPKSIRIKLKYIKEYITMRDMNFVVCYEFMYLIPEIPQSWNIKFDEKTISEKNWIYNHLIRVVLSDIQSWIIGKVFIEPNKEKTYHFDGGKEKYEKFITGFDENGDEIYENCSKTNDKYFKTTFFKKDVLNKYYDEPNKYEVDGFHVSCNSFSLKIDNNVENYVPVFLVDLSSLPYMEQLHWKHYNISPQDEMEISETYYKTMIEGNWSESPATPDLFFKYKYKQFNNRWEKKFGWKFYKPLSKEDQHIFKSLYLPPSNNVKTFCEQMLSIVKLTIDRLNESGLKKDIILEDGDRGITKLEKFLKVNNRNLPDMITFLKKLWDLRSGLLAHTFSNSNKKCKDAINFFGIKNDNYTEVAKEIFIKSVYTMNTLEKYFLIDNKNN